VKHLLVPGVVSRLAQARCDSHQFSAPPRTPRALAVARKQQAKSWELRVAMSMARLQRDQGKRVEARELLAPVTAGLPKGLTRAICRRRRGYSMSFRLEFAACRVCCR
jgi:predicted ATPase